MLISPASCAAPLLLASFFRHIADLFTRVRQGSKMKKSVRVFDEQYLAQSTAELLALKAEIQKLEDLIRVAEAAKRGRSVQQLPLALAS